MLNHILEKFVVCVQFMLFASLCFNVQTANAKELTFQGVAFGSSVSELRKEYGGLVCKDDVLIDDRPIVACGANVSNYLGHPGYFIATFVADRLSTVVFSWPVRIEESGETLRAIRDRVTQGIGSPAQDSLAAWTPDSHAPVAIWTPQPTQQFQLSACVRDGLLLKCDPKSIKAILSDTRFQRAPKKDF